MHEPRLEIHPLTPRRMPDFLRYFDEDAFSDNPKWASCYCQCFYEDHRVVVWKDRTAVQNRAKACERVAARTMRGWLAYRGDVVVGWCNAPPRPLLHALDEDPVDDAEMVGSIGCFVVRPDLRRQGVARRLLAAAIDGFRADGLRVVEAYPRKDFGSVAESHFGPLDLFLSSGFAIVREDDDGGLVVRRAL